MEVLRLGGGSGEIWIRALGIAAIVGAVLTLSALGEGASIRSLGGWRIFRFHLIPFCVSSYSSLTQGKGYWLVFPPHVRDNLVNLLVMALTVLILVIAERLRQARTASGFNSNNSI